MVGKLRESGQMVYLIMLLVLMLLPVTAFAGPLDSPGAPSAGSGMPTLNGIWEQLNSGTAATTGPTFQEPASGPTVGTGSPYLRFRVNCRWLMLQAQLPGCAHRKVFLGTA